jgi:type I restriction enzyme S subunit
MKWEKKRIRDFAVVYDGPHATPKESTSGPIFLGIKNIRPEGGIELTDIRHISDSEYDKWTKRVTPRKDDIVLSYEATLHRYAIIPESFIGCLGRRMALVRVNENGVNHKFIYYTFLSDSWRGFIDANKLTGATVDRISITDFPDYKINLPSLPTQRKIASILSAYDDLIENNLKRIKLLEEKAFLRYKGIVREEKLETRILSDFGDIITGKTPSTAKADYFDDDVPFIKTPDMHNQIFIENTVQMLSDLGAKSQEKKFLPPLSLCVSCIGTAGVVGITSKPSQTNQQINSIVFFETENVYFFYALMSQMKEQLDALGSNGSTFTNVNKNKFENMEVIVPNQKILSEYAEEFEASFSLILTLQKKNTKLREARDILLPKLMSGQIEV